MAERIVVENRALRLALEPDGRVAELSNIMSGLFSNRGRELFRLRYRGEELAQGDFPPPEVSRCRDSTQELVTLLFRHRELPLEMRVQLINDLNCSISVLYQLRDHSRPARPAQTLLRCPLLAELEFSGDDLIRLPGDPVPGEPGRPVLRPVRESSVNSDAKPPLVVTDREDRYGFSVLFPTLSDLNNEGAAQNRNMDLCRIETLEQLRGHWLAAAPDDSFADTVELLITGLEGGWEEAFDRFRTRWESFYDLSEYRREDLGWFSRCAVHNFTFLFGSEGFDLQAGRIDPEKLLRQGEEFGGYDTVTIWNQYPRLGVDQRSQWEFFDQFPGGRAAIREMAELLHSRGVYLFLPYIPWDRGEEESTGSMGDRLAELIADTDADGCQLDTMNSIPESFRRKLDRVRPGLVFTSQAHPAKGRALELITTSWDEFWRSRPMPEADILRFLCPRHISPVISRWLREEDKTLLIRRAEFSAAPIVIWQDVFGRWMPYSDAQKAEVARWKGVYLKYREIFQCARPTPLIPTGRQGLYCNLFPADEGSGCIYSLYNAAEEAAECSLRLRRPAESLQVILGDGSGRLEEGRLVAVVQPGEVLQLLTR